MKVIAKKNRELALINARNTQNENKAETIELVVPEEYESYNKKIVFITDDGVVWDVITNNEYKITNAITKYKQVDFYIWLTKEVDGESIDFRTKTKTLIFYYNEDASDEITDEEIHGVNTVVNLLEEEIEKVENLDIEATKVGNTATITITKKDGTTQSVNITDGQNGQDGKDGQDGQPGQDGKDAKINGKNSIEIEAGENITIDDTERGIRINSTGKSEDIFNYNDLENKPKINNVELIDNKTLHELGIQPEGNYITEETDPTVPNHVKEIKQNDIVSWNNKANTSDIPDVSNFITNAVNNLLNYYLKSETYTKQEVNNLIGQIATLQFQVVNELPQTGDSKYIYLVPSANPKTQNVKDEYIWTNNAWEQIGNTQVDLTGYATETWVNTQISGFLTQTQIQNLITTALTEYAKEEDIPTKTSDLTNDSGFITGYTETDPTVPSHVKNITQTNIASWNNKQNSISDLSTIRSGANAGATAVQPNDLATVATSGSYNDLSNKPTIPSEVTESIVAGWGFTKNTGTYSKPSGGIPKTDLTNEVQTSLGKADTALQSHQDISGKEDKTNKVTSISNSSTNTQYPSALAVYNYIQSLNGNGVSY